MIIDLCCGKGRWETTEPVVSIDFDSKTKPDIIADIRYLPLRGGLRPRLVHASPPCTYFSKARRWRWGVNLKGIGESLELVGSCFKAFDYLEAKHWTLENPVGFLGRVFNQTQIEYGGYDLDRKPTHFWSNMKGLKRAIIPQNIRQRILKEAEV